MRRGEQFKRIFSLFSEGKTAAEIIDLGFPESSVYWAQAKIKAGEKPLENVRREPDWMRAYRSMRLVHDCDDGRLGQLEDREIETDEGIRFELTCNTCGEILQTRFEKWPPDSKERYKLYKRTGRSNFDLNELFRRARSDLLRR